MARKKFGYRGIPIEELQAMSMDELVKIMPSRIRRSLKRGFTDSQANLMARVKKQRKILDKGGRPKAIKTHRRDMPVLPEMVGLRFEVYNGGAEKGNKAFTSVEIIPEMIGQYLGEFSMTRGIIKHSAPGVGATRSSMFVERK